MISQEMILSNKEIENFLTKYISEYLRLVNEKYSELKDKTSLYYGYPYEINVFTNKFTTNIEYQLNSTFSININRVDKIPKIESKKGFKSEGYINIYLKRIISKPELKAQRDISDLISYLEHEEQEQEYWENEWKKYEQEMVENTVTGFGDFLKKAYPILEKTFSDKKAPMYNLIKVIQNQSIMLESYLKSGCLTLFDTLFETMYDLESSIFLVSHGKYETAMGLLRRYLETTICSLYYDAEISKYKTTSKTY